MKRYRCECSVDKCEFKSEKNFFPIFCPNFSTTMGKWTKIEEEIKEEERAEELPSWCKVGELVYYNDSYYTIVEMNGQYEVKITNGVEDEWVKTSNVLEARLRPFNETEMRELVGKVIANKTTKTRYLIVTSNSICVSAAGYIYDKKELLNGFIFTNEQPCGVYEHLENGEWVE